MRIVQRAANRTIQSVPMMRCTIRANWAYLLRLFHCKAGTLMTGAVGWPPYRQTRLMWCATLPWQCAAVLLQYEVIRNFSVNMRVWRAYCRQQLAWLWCILASLPAGQMACLLRSAATQAQLLSAAGLVYSLRHASRERRRAVTDSGAAALFLAAFLAFSIYQAWL